MNKVLIADDNTQIAKVLKDYAGKEGWGSYIAYDGEEALRLFRDFEKEITIVFLDVMMPKKDGFSVCKAIRAMSQVPVIMITARGEDADKIMGLDIGADDYIVKPFSTAEVMARARAILRRIPQQEDTGSRKLRIANLAVDLDNYMVTIDEKKVLLTKKEIELLWLLATNTKKVFTRDNLLDSLWGYDYFGDVRTVDSHIKRLRAKLDAFEHPAWAVKTIWGVGYRFEVTEMPVNTK